MQLVVLKRRKASLLFITTERVISVIQMCLGSVGLFVISKYKVIDEVVVVIVK